VDSAAAAAVAVAAAAVVAASAGRQIGGEGVLKLLLRKAFAI
jgi:hypothetical protein